jgi:hypothetical protein
MQKRFYKGCEQFTALLPSTGLKAWGSRGVISKLDTLY